MQLTKSKISGVGKADASAAAVEAHGVNLAGSVIGGSEAEAATSPPTPTASPTSPTTAKKPPAAERDRQLLGHDRDRRDPTPLPLVGTKVDDARSGQRAAGTTLATTADRCRPSSGTRTRPKARSSRREHRSPGGDRGDDFGVFQVAFRLAGGALGVSPQPAINGERVYQIDWTPTAGQSGANRTLTAVALDSNNQESTVSITVNIKGAPRLGGSAGTIAGKVGGYALVGKPLTCDGTDASFPAAAIAYA